MSTTEQAIADITIDKITSGYNKDRENWNVEALIKICIEARNLAIKYTSFLRIQRTHQEHVYLLICYHSKIQLSSDMEYKYLSYIDPKYMETGVMWSMAFQAIYENHQASQFCGITL